MISCDKEKVTIKGKRVVVMSELQTLICALIKDCDVEAEDIIDAVADALAIVDHAPQIEELLQDDDFKATLEKLKGIFE